MEGATVYTSHGQSFRCRKVVLAIPSNVYEKIEFSPPLPADKHHIVSHTKPGLLSKAVVTYRSAWWKELGLMGKMLSFREPVSVTFDISNADDQQYSLAAFIAGDPGQRWAALSDTEREKSIIEHIADMVGPENASLARDVLEINYSCWSEEEYLGGAPTAIMGPGLLSRYGDALREPFQNIHIAGTETAFEWKGYLEGALLAGSRSAAEVIGILHEDK